MILYFALQKIGAHPDRRARRPIATTRFQPFVQIAEAVACVYPERQSDFDFAPMVARIAKESPFLRHRIVLGRPREGEAVARRADRAAGHARARAELEKIKLDPTDPCIFQLSGGTTGVPKLIPRTHNDYAYNSKTAAKVCEVERRLGAAVWRCRSRTTCRSRAPASRASSSTAASVVLSRTTRPEDMFPLVEKHRVTHIKVVPALLIRLINSPAVTQYDTSSVRFIQSGGQRLAAGSAHPHQGADPGDLRAGKFRHVRGHAVLRAQRRSRRRAARNGRAADLARRRGAAARRRRPHRARSGEVGELCARGPYTLRGYYGAPEHNQRAFTSDGFYRSGDLMRQHPSGNYMVEGRKKDLINRGGEKISAEEIENLILSASGGARTSPASPCPIPTLGERMCACVILRPRQDASRSTSSCASSTTKEIAKFKLPERLEVADRVPALDIRQGVEESAGRDGDAKARGRAGAEGRLSDAHHRPALLSQHRTLDHMPGALCRGAGAILEPHLDVEGGGRGRRGIHRRRGRGGAGGARSRDDGRHAALLERLCRAPCSSATRTASSNAGARSIRSRARSRARRRGTRSDDLGMLGFHFHPIMGHFAVNDRQFYPLFEVINELKAPVMIDVGTTGMGAGMPGGLGRAHPPRASLRDSTISPPIFPTSRSSPPIPAGRGSTR